MQGVDLKSSLDVKPIKEGVYKVLESTCISMKKLSLIAEKSEFHIAELRETMQNNPRASRQIVLANFKVINKSLQEGEEQVQCALEEIEKVQNEIDSVLAKLEARSDNNRPELQKRTPEVDQRNGADDSFTGENGKEIEALLIIDNEELKGSRDKNDILKRNHQAQDALDKSKCLHETIQKIFLEWKDYKKYFDSIHDSIVHGVDVTEKQTNVISEEISLTNTLHALNIYVKSMRTSTHSFVRIYNEDVIHMVRAFYIGTVKIPENIQRKIENRYYELLKKEGQSAISQHLTKSEVEHPSTWSQSSIISCNSSEVFT